MCEITPPSHHFTYLAMDDPSALMAEHSCSKNWLHAGQGYLDPPFLPFLIAIESFLPSRHIKAKEGACTGPADQGGQRGHKGVHILVVSESKPFHLNLLKRHNIFGPSGGNVAVGATSKEPKQHEEWSDLLQIRPWASKQAKQAHSTYYCTLVHLDEISSAG